MRSLGKLDHKKPTRLFQNLRSNQPKKKLTLHNTTIPLVCACLPQIFAMSNPSQQTTSMYTQIPLFCGFLQLHLNQGKWTWNNVEHVFNYDIKMYIMNPYKSQGLCLSKLHLTMFGFPQPGKTPTTSTTSIKTKNGVSNRIFPKRRTGSDVWGDLFLLDLFSLSNVQG